jgi:His/Glu/Gln/Arg/opine family amino acid ABC transporter permease subunit
VTFDWSVVWTHRWALFEGAGMTIVLTVLTMMIAVPGGILLAAMRLAPTRLLRWPAACFVEFFRCTPLVIQVYWAFYVLPAEFGVQLSGFATGLLALSLNVSAFNSETFRAGISSIRRGQGDAGLAMGMSKLQVFRIVILPQAVKRVLPVLATTWVALFKDTSLVSVIAVSDLAYSAMQLRSRTFRILEFLTAMAVLYWAMGYPQAKLTDWIHRRMAGRE